MIMKGQVRTPGQPYVLNMALFRRRQAPPPVQVAHVHQHSVTFYSHDDALIGLLEQYVVDGARRGETTVVIATPHHRAMLRERLASWELEDAFLGLDAQDCLDRFMVDGLPDPYLFELTIGTLVRDRAGTGMRAFGEMVSLLWEQDNVEGTLQLEELWNGLQREVAFPLLCAYGERQFEGREGRDDVCGTHTSVLPIAS